MTEQRNTWLPFSRAEVRQIRASATEQPGATPPCPICGAVLTLEGPRRQAYDVRCNACHRNTVLPQELLDTPI